MLVDRHGLGSLIISSAVPLRFSQHRKQVSDSQAINCRVWTLILLSVALIIIIMRDNNIRKYIINSFFLVSVHLSLSNGEVPDAAITL